MFRGVLRASAAETQGVPTYWSTEKRRKRARGLSSPPPRRRGSRSRPRCRSARGRGPGRAPMFARAAESRCFCKKKRELRLFEILGFPSRVTRNVEQRMKEVTLDHREEEDYRSKIALRGGGMALTRPGQLARRARLGSKE